MIILGWLSSALMNQASDIDKKKKIDNDKKTSASTAENSDFPFQIKITKTVSHSNTVTGCDVQKTKIAGVTYRCTTDDVGGFLGYAAAEPTNANDKNAVALYRVDGKHLGYIPKGETAEFHASSNGKVIPFVGYIDEGDSAPLYGMVWIIYADSQDELELESLICVRRIVREKGKSFLPMGVNLPEPLPKTKAALIETLDREIEAREEDLYEEVEDSEEEDE